MTIKTRNIAAAAITAAKIAAGTLTDSTALANSIVAAAALDATATGAISNTSDGLLALRCARVTFDASLVGNQGVGAHAPGPVTIPIKGWVVGGFFDVNTAFTSAGANTGEIAISVEGANDIQTSAAVSGAPYSSINRKAIVPKGNTPESTGIKCTVARDITFTVAVQDLTAGKLTCFLFYLVAA